MKIRLSAVDQSWLDATFARNHARFGDLRMEGETEPATEAFPPAETPPAEKPFADLSADEKVEFLLAKTRRLEDAAKGKSRDPDVRALRQRVKELEPFEQQMKDLAEASQTEAERAVRKAQADGEKAGRESALAEARKTYGSQLVAVKLDSAAESKGMTAEQMRKAAGDLARFLDEAGVDEEALGDFLSALPDRAAQALPLGRDAFGAGRRASAQPSGLERGAARYYEKNKQKTSPA